MHGHDAAGPRREEPLLLGEIAIRALVLRQRGRVPFATTALVNLWERLMDVTALALIGALLVIGEGLSLTFTRAGLMGAGAALATMAFWRRGARVSAKSSSTSSTRAADLIGLRCMNTSLGGRP